MDFRTLRSKCALLVTVCVLGMGAAGNAAAQTITLEWDQSSTASVGYRVHVGTASGSYSQHFDVGAATLFAFNTAVAGQRYCFAVSAYLLSSQLDGPNSAEVCGYSDAPPTLQNPGSRTSTVGQPVTLQLVGSDPQSQPLTYSATGLPPGLSVMASTGFISGTGTTAGTYNVTARANDGSLTATEQFTWVMSAATTSPPTTPPPTTTPPPPTTPTSSVTLTAQLREAGTVYLRWTDGKWLGVDIYRNGAFVRRVQNDGNVTDSLPSAGRYDYQLCAGGSTTVCSNIVTVDYASSTIPTIPTIPTDTTRPTISIATPTTGTLYSTMTSSLNLTGSAADNVGVAQVRWSNDRGGSGIASGTTGWGAAGIPLQTGTNVITVTALDAAGNVGTDSLTVNYSGTTPPPPPPPTSSVILTTQLREWGTVYLRWTDGKWLGVDIYRNGAFVRRVQNDGNVTDSLPSSGRYDYQLCAGGSTTVCSNIATVSY
jgi:hypothetical protein